MRGFNNAAKETLHIYGVTQADWRREHAGSPTEWYGDTCGCPDDRCIGFHHDPDDDCGCLTALLGDYLAARRKVTA